MALAGTFAHLGVVALFAGVAAAFGMRLLGWMKLEPTSRLEEALYGAGLSIAALEVVIFLLGMAGWLDRTTLLALLAAMALLAGRAWLRLGGFLRGAIGFLRERKRSEKLLLLAVACFLILDALMAMAPLTGSDAMNYHFTAPLLEVGKRFAPNFWLPQSFLTGQTHMLILAGLTLGSDHISLGLIYLGGVLAASALFLLACEWMPAGWALTTVLAFVLTPLVYWQMTTAGAPDIWMAYYTTAAVLAAARGAESRAHRWFFLAGVFAGAAGAAKYPALAIPAILAVLIAFESKSLRAGTLSAFASLAVGVYPLARNFWWTHDPFFPFLTRWMAPTEANPYALAMYVSETRASRAQMGLARLLEYPFLVVLKGDAYGVGHYLGPLVLAFAPLLGIGLKRTPLVRIAGALWAGVLLSNALTSQMGRFLLPVFPIALVFVFAGVARVAAGDFPIARVGCQLTLLLFFLFAGGTYSLYGKDFFPVALGLEKREAFLERMAPDYELAEFVNQSLDGQPGKVLVFFRHIYYLRVPFVNGDPATSWLMNPERYRTPDQLMQLFRGLGIRWVAKIPQYPEPFAEIFGRLEAAGTLRPVQERDVETFSGWRVYGVRPKVHAVIFRVVEPAAGRQ